MKFLISLSLSLLSISAFASSFMGRYTCSGGYQTYIVGSKKIEQGLVTFSGNILRDERVYREDLLDECKASYVEEVPCSESSQYCDDDESNVEEEFQRDWNVIEIYLSEISKESICSNVPDIKNFLKKEDLVIDYMRNHGLVQIGGQSQYDITSEACISIAF